MFTIEQRRRYVLRTLFVVLCVLPSLGLAGWALWRSAPFHHRAEEAKLGRVLGLNVRFNDVSHPRPGVSRYSWLHLRDPETAALIARIESLEVSGSSRTLRIVATRPTFESTALATAWELLDRLMRGRDRLGVSRVRLMIDGGLVLHSPEGDHSFNEVTADFEEAPPGLRTQLTFRMEGDVTDTPAVLKVSRDRLAQRPVTAMEFVTGETPLPCSLVAPFFNTPGWLGPDCRFHGRLWAARRIDGWDTQITGWFSAIDLEQFVSKHFVHKMTGRAELALSRARIHRGRIVEAQGALVAGPGRVSRSLIVAAHDTLECPAHPFASIQNHTEPFDRLALDFALDSSGLTLQGHLADASPGALMVYRGQTLLEQPGRRQPASGLIQAMADTGGRWVPLSTQSQWLMSVLPGDGRTAALDITTRGEANRSARGSTATETPRSGARVTGSVPR